MGCCSSKLVDDLVAETPSKGEAQQEAQQETQQETQPKGEMQGGMPCKGQRARDTATLLLTSIISEASDLLKPMKAVSEFIKKILEVTKVRPPCSRNPKAGAGGRRRLEGPHSLLKSHLTAVESQTNNLEEDQSLGETPPPYIPIS